jgi:hypothetical protein
MLYYYSNYYSAYRVHIIIFCIILLYRRCKIIVIGVIWWLSIKYFFIVVQWVGAAVEYYNPLKCAVVYVDSDAGAGPLLYLYYVYTHTPDGRGVQFQFFFYSPPTSHRHSARRLIHIYIYTHCSMRINSPKQSLPVP